MKIEQKQYTKQSGWKKLNNNGLDPAKCSLVLAFGSRELLSDPALYNNLKREYHNAGIVMNSTAGEIIDVHVDDDTISLTAIELEKTPIETASISIDNLDESYRVGKQLAEALNHEDLRYVLVISDGQKVNGSDLVAGLRDYLPEKTILTGGLAGDGPNFEKTLVGLNENPTEGRVVAVGFYGGQLTVTSGSVGGWDPFGPERLVTKSKGNILYELDGKPALDTYKLYLGEYSKDLPQSGLLFPLSIRNGDGKNSLVRTILGVDESEKSLVFAGNVPEGYYARLMKANFDRLIEGSLNAAQNTLNGDTFKPDLAILISCVGRKLVLDQRIEEEVEVVRATYGNNTAIAGFYSYGEISHSKDFLKCELHNQTMTITTLSEA